MSAILNLKCPHSKRTYGLFPFSGGFHFSCVFSKICRFFVFNCFTFSDSFCYCFPAFFNSYSTPLPRFHSPPRILLLLLPIPTAACRRGFSYFSVFTNRRAKPKSNKIPSLVSRQYKNITDKLIKLLK